MHIFRNQMVLLLQPVVLWLHDIMITWHYDYTSDNITLWLQQLKLWLQHDMVTTTLDCDYRKFLKYSDSQKICCNPSKIWTMWLHHRVMNPNDADGMANSVDPD